MTAARWRTFPWWNVLLFLATLFATVRHGADFAGFDGSFSGALVLSGLPYAVGVLAILTAHEMGHWLLARAWGVDTTLPYFLPGWFFGTFGAVIRIRSALPSRAAVLDVGAAGPIAGAIVAIPLYAWGLAHSRVHAVAQAGAAGSESLAALVLSWVRDTPPAAGGGGLVFGDSLLTLAIQRLVVGPLPPGHDVVVHPVAVAAWFGLFVTALNLLPLGQLDGGHVAYAWLGERRAFWLSRVVSGALLAAGVFLSMNWLLWWALTRMLVGLRHPPALLEEPVRRGRSAVAVASLVLFVLTFVPIPFRL